MNTIHLIGFVFFVFPIALLCILLSQNQFIDIFSLNSYSSRWMVFNSESNLPYSERFSKDSSLADSCELPILDPWDRTIQNYINPNYKEYKECIVVEQPVETILSKGTLKIVQHDVNSTYNCAFRCLTFKTEFNYNASAWEYIESSIETECEIIQTRCLVDNETSYYENLHTQIPKVQSPIKSSNINESFKPSVFVFIFDSVSNSNGLRSLAATSQVLRYKYDAVNFRGLNKVGLNSRPNAWALFTGVRITPLPAGTIHEEEIEAEVPDSCNKYVDNFPFVGRYFSAAGYSSTMIEDWAQGAFTWPNCYGFHSNPFTHNMKPYWQALDTNGGTPKLLQEKCKRTYDVSMEYFEQFLRAYDVNVPKFGVVWLSELAHNFLNGLYQTDLSLAKFFIKYEAQFENSFIFLMGDHGLRFTAIRGTKIGQFEDNNPFLTISVPKRLRRNVQLMRNLNLNSQVLITHFDLYLTLMDIAAVSPISNFTDFSFFDWSGYMPKDRGSSILRPINSSGRNCKSLDIPEMFCNCKRNVTELTDADSFNTNTSIIYKGAQVLTLALNNIIKEFNALDKCSELNLKSVNSAENDNRKRKDFLFNYLYGATK